MGIKEIVAKGGKVAGIVFKRCTQVFDADRMFKPLYNECELLELEADNVIFAIGQSADMTGFTGTSLEVDERGRIRWNPATFQTNLTNVFACGEVVMRPGSSVAAMRNAHDAVIAIKTYLTTGKAEPVPTLRSTSIGRIPQVTISMIPQLPKNSLPVLDPAIRVKSFAEVEGGFDIATAMYEAGRCMNCSRGAKLGRMENCAACLSCLRICPYGAPYITAECVADFLRENCGACGLCASVCPGLAIDIAFNHDTRIDEQIDAGVSGVTVFGCQYAMPTVKNPSFLVTPSMAGINMINLMCTSRLDLRHLLRAITNGVDGVAVLACQEEKYRHRQGVNLVRARTNEVKKILETTGVGADRIVCFGVPASTGEFSRLMAEFKARLDKLGPNPLSKR